MLERFPEDEGDIGEWMSGMWEELAVEVVRYIYQNYELTQLEKSMPS